MRFLVLLTIMAFFALPVATCGVNLFAVMAGTTKQYGSLNGKLSTALKSGKAPQ